MFWAAPAQAEDPAAPVVVVVTTPGGDDSSYQVPLTTTVTFDGVTYDSVYATTNSVITFGQPDGTYWTYPQTPSISLYSMDWVVFPDRGDEHLIISASDGGFQVDISARPYGIWDYQTIQATNINIVAAINTDGTVSISYSIAGPTYEGSTRTGVRLTDGSIVTLEQYGIVKVDQPPVLEPVPVDPTPTPTPTVEPTPTPTPTPEPTVDPITPPAIPQGAILLSEGLSFQVIAPEGQRIVSITAWYGDPSDGTRGLDVSSTLTQLASGQTSVTIDSNNIYGDPAPGTVKTLIFVVNYEGIPTPEPTITPTPEPTQIPVIIEPTPLPTVQPTEEPVVPTPEPTVEPTIPPTEEPTPEPTSSQEPAKEPTQVEPEPIREPEQTTATEVLGQLKYVDPTDLTDAQVEQLKDAALETFKTSEPGSPEYTAALEALMTVAQADDPVLPAELAAIPGAQEVLAIFNALGNLGADMSPQVREESKQIVVAAVVVGQVAQTAMAAASSAASSGGSSGPRRRIK